MMLTNNILRFIILLTLSIASLASLAQNVQLEINAPSKVKVGQTFQVKYNVTIDNDAEVELTEVDSFKNFTLLYGPSRSKSTTVVRENDQPKRTVIITNRYTLQATTIGKYTIPAIEVTVDGEKHQSEAHKIQVTPATYKKDYDKEENSDSIDAFIRTEISRKRANTSDTLRITYKLYTTVDVSRVVDANYPSIIKDFYSRDITPKYVLYGSDVIDGKEYKTIEIHTLILQPHNEGFKKIRGGNVIIEFLVPTDKSKKEGEDNVIRREQRRFDLEEATIEVMNLIDI